MAPNGKVLGIDVDPQALQRLRDAAEKAKVELSDKNSALFYEINTFNIKGRYDDYKSKFYKIATKTYAKKYLEETKKIIAWLKKQ